MSGLRYSIQLRKRAYPPAVARAIRQEAGVSVQEIADEVGVDRVTVHRWEAGTRRPGGDLLRRYIEVLDMISEEMAK